MAGRLQGLRQLDPFLLLAVRTAVSLVASSATPCPLDLRILLEEGLYQMNKPGMAKN
jgi:hypothetical protein